MAFQETRSPPITPAEWASGRATVRGQPERQREARNSSPSFCTQDRVTRLPKIPEGLRRFQRLGIWIPTRKHPYALAACVTAHRKPRSVIADQV